MAPSLIIVIDHLIDVAVSSFGEDVSVKRTQTTFFSRLEPNRRSRSPSVAVVLAPKHRRNLIGSSLDAVPPSLGSQSCLTPPAR